MEGAEKKTPESVVVGSFLTPSTVHLSGNVKTSHVQSNSAGVMSPLFVPVMPEPKMNWRDWTNQLLYTNNGRFKLLLMGTIFAFFTIIPLMMEIAYDNYDYHEENLTDGQVQFVEDSTVNELLLINMNLTTFETDIPDHYRHSDYEYVDFYYVVENGNHEMCNVWYNDNSQGYYAGDWKAVNCYYDYWDEPTGEKLVYYMVDFENNELLVASQHYNVDEVWIEFETHRSNDGLEMIANILPCLGCMLIPISIIGIFVTREKKLPAQLVH